MPVHVGLHAGDVIREEDNVFGGAVNIAARISALSAAGEVLVSATVRDLGRTSAGVVFEDRGEVRAEGGGGGGAGVCGARGAIDGEPQIRYARAVDGVNIAYCTMGDGRRSSAAGGSNWPISNVQYELETPSIARGERPSRRRRMLVRYDHEASDSRTGGSGGSRRTTMSAI